MTRFGSKNIDKIVFLALDPWTKHNRRVYGKLAASCKYIRWQRQSGSRQVAALYVWFAPE